MERAKTPDRAFEKNPPAQANPPAAASEENQAVSASGKNSVGPASGKGAPVSDSSGSSMASEFGRTARPAAGEGNGSGNSRGGFSGAILDRITPVMVRGRLSVLAAVLNRVPSYRHHLVDVHPTGTPFRFEAVLEFLEEERSTGVHIVCSGGRMKTGNGPAADADVTVRFLNAGLMREFFSGGDSFSMLLDNTLTIEGNLSYLLKFAHMSEAVTRRNRKLPRAPEMNGDGTARSWEDMRPYPAGEPCRERPDGEVTHLDDPYLASYTVENFPSIKRLLWVSRVTRPAICAERPRLLTEFLLQNGRENGNGAALRQAGALRHILASREPIIYDDDLLAGTTTSKRIGVIIFPELGGTGIWPELLTVEGRELNPYDISREDIETLNREVFPFWMDDNVREWTRRKHDRPDTLELDERFVLYFMWKTQAASHTVVDVPRALSRGLDDIAKEAGERMEAAGDPEKRSFYRALREACAGVTDYAENLAARAEELAAAIETGGAVQGDDGIGRPEAAEEDDGSRAPGAAGNVAFDEGSDAVGNEVPDNRHYTAGNVAVDERHGAVGNTGEEVGNTGGTAGNYGGAVNGEGNGSGSAGRKELLLEMARICRKVPAKPAETLHEALQAIWILFVAQHMENMNAGMVVGRLDVWLNPFLQRELDAAPGDDERRRRIERALELTCAFMLKLTDHLPLVPDVGNRLFGGSSENQVITLGGLTEDGGSAVNDMTWILLKATEMLHLRDPNMNARFAPGVNSDAYLRRLCEVNLLTGATPSLHNDDAMVPALVAQGFPLEHARDWTATGCVEPTSCGRHFGHTNSMMFNMVAPLEMTFHRGAHPLLRRKLGPDTGDPAAFETYDEFLAAYKAQLGWLIDKSMEANNMLGMTHRKLKPTPLLSALFTGPMESGKDIIDGGALYNTSGVAMVGLADVIDSLLAVRTLVYERRDLDMAGLLAALEADFAGYETVHALILNRTPRFGRDDEAALETARDVIDFVFERYQAGGHYRGGRYLPGYWSMSNHVAFGVLSGALPSGRRRGKAFTPGLTPSHLSGGSLTDQIRTVASLDSKKFPNNIAFNVKVAPGPGDTHAMVVDRMTAYAAAYFGLGGMQMQFNAVRTETLREAMENPEAYRDLLVRISGYNAYFVDLNRDIQQEVVERMEHSLANGDGR